MKIKIEFPPNWSFITEYFKDLPLTAIFAWSDCIYNPFNAKIREDHIVHEAVHSRQIAEMASSYAWWEKYAEDATYRLNCEVEAYSAQLNFILKYVPEEKNNIVDNFADTIASPMYNLNVKKSHVATLIRKKARELKKV